MTKASLERGQEIQYEINDLKTSLNIISKANFFNLERGMGCSPNRYGDAFLAILESDLKKDAQTKILNRIQSLETDFEVL